MKDLKKYIKSKIKDKKLAEKIIDKFSGKPGIVSLDLCDVKAVIDKAKEIKFLSGSTDDIIKKIINPGKVNGMLLQAEGNKNITLDDVRLAVEKITQNINEKATVIWGATINKRLRKTKTSAVAAY